MILDFIRDNLNGSAWEDLCDAIMDVLDKEEYRHEAVARCKEDIEKNYTWNATAKKFVSIL